MSTTALTIAFAVLAALVVALAVAVALLYREQRRRRFDEPTVHAVADALQGGRDEEALTQLLEYLEDLTGRVNSLAEHARALDQTLERFRDRSRAHLQRIGAVRFDASESVSGRLSCALAILDAHNSGFLITTLYDLERSRTFVRAVKAGRTDKELLEPERQALDMAVRSGLSASPDNGAGEGTNA